MSLQILLGVTQMTTNDQNPTAGKGDPYWYEWSIGPKSGTRTGPFDFR